MQNLRIGTGNTKVGTKLDFNVMANPFRIKKLTEKQAIKLIKDAGFKIRREKQFGKVVNVKPVGDSDEVYEFIENLIEQRIYTENGAIGIK
jgi:hypothetical protein